MSKPQKFQRPFHRIIGRFGTLDDHFPHPEKNIDLPAHPLEERVVKFDSEVIRNSKKTTASFYHEGHEGPRSFFSNILRGTS